MVLIEDIFNYSLQYISYVFISVIAEHFDTFLIVVMGHYFSLTSQVSTFATKLHLVSKCC
jgi:hypothetical protein